MHPEPGAETARRSLARHLVAGALTGVAGALLFVTLHALVILPIWSRGVRGLPFAILGGAAVGWAYFEIADAHARWTHGLVFGALAWLALVPTTALAALLRISGWRTVIGGAEDVIEIAVVVLVGGAIGWWRARRRRAVIAAAVALTALFLTMAGPIPVPNGRRPLLLWLGFLPLFAMAGALLAILGRAIGYVPGDAEPAGDAPAA